MTDSDTLTVTRDKASLDLPWKVIVYDDPVNLMGYVTWVFMKIFGYDKKRATVLMREVHEQGRSVVWVGQRERAELYVQQLHAHQLKATMEKET